MRCTLLVLVGAGIAALILPLAFLPWESPLLREFVETSLRRRLGPDAIVRAGTVQLDSGPPGYLILRVADLDAEVPGAWTARIGTIDLHLPLAGLLLGRTTPSRIDVHGADVSWEAAPSTQNRLPRTGFDAGTQHVISVVDSRLHAPTGVTIAIALGEARLGQRPAPRIRAAGAFLADGSAVPFAVTTTPTPEFTRTTLRVDGLPLAPLTRRLLPELPGFLDGTISLHARALFTKESALERVDFEVSGEGPVTLTPPHLPTVRLATTSLRAAASYDPSGSSWSRGSLSANLGGPELEISQFEYDPARGTLAAVVGLRAWPWNRLDALVPPRIATPTRKLLAGLAEQPTIDCASAAVRIDLAGGSPDAWRIDLLAEATTPRGPARVAGEAEGLADGSVRAAADLHALPLVPVLVGVDAITDGAVSDIPVSGSLALRLDRTTLRSAALHLVLGDGWIEVPAWLPGRCTVSGGRLRATFEDGSWRVETARLDVEGASLQGSFQTSPARSELAFRARRIDMARLERLWPRPLLPNVRNQVLRFVPSGEVLEATGRVILPAELSEPLEVSGEARYRNLRIDTQLGLPDFEDVHGTASFDARSLRFAIEGGSWHGSTLRTGGLLFTGFDTPRQHLELQLSVKGGFPSFRPLLRFLPTGLAAALDDAFAPSGGTGELQLRVGIPLLRDLMLADCPIDGTIRFRDVAPRLPIAGVTALVHEGTAHLRADATSVIAEVQIARARLDWPNAGLEGVLGAQLRFTDAGNTERLEVSADLDGLDARLPVAGVSKMPGQTGRFAATLHLTGLEPVEASAELDLGESVGLHARCRLGRHSGRSRIEDLSVRADPLGGSRFAANLSRTDGAGLHLDLDGATLDLGPLFASEGGEPPSTPPTDTFLRPPHDPFEMELRVDTLRLGPDFELADARVDGVFSGGRWRILGARGAVGGAPFEASVGPEDSTGSQALRLRSRDAGGLLRALDVTRRVGGGTLEADGTVRQGPGALRFDVALSLSDFRLLEAPVFARILAAASLTGLPSALGRQGLPFSGLEARITYEGGVIEITDALLWGNELGVQLTRARLDLNTRTQTLEGVLWPGYALNALFRNVPVVNWILTGPGGKGLVGVGFRAEGSLENPEVRANRLPTVGVLSALLDARRRLGMMPSTGP